MKRSYTMKQFTKVTNRIARATAAPQRCKGGRKLSLRAAWKSLSSVGIYGSYKRKRKLSHQAQHWCSVTRGGGSLKASSFTGTSRHLARGCPHRAHTRRKKRGTVATLRARHARTPQKAPPQTRTPQPLHRNSAQHDSPGRIARLLIFQKQARGLARTNSQEPGDSRIQRDATLTPHTLSNGEAQTPGNLAGTPARPTAPPALRGPAQAQLGALLTN